MYQRLRIQYLVSYGLSGAYMPYAPLFLHQIGLDDTQIGWVLGIAGIAVLVMPLVTTYLADKHVPNRVLLAASLGLSAVTLLLTAFAVSGFLTALLLLILFSLASTSISSLTDGLTFALIHEDEKHGRQPPQYHALRLWGSVGFILPTVALLFIYHRNPNPDYSLAMTVAAASCLAGMVTSLFLPKMAKPPGEKPRKLPTLDAFATLRHKQMLAFIAPLFLINAAMYAYYSFYTRRLEELGVDGSYMGMIFSIGVVVEIAIMLVSGRLLHVIGVKGVLLMGAVSVIARMALLAWSNEPLVLIATQVLHGPIVMCVHLVPPMYLNLKAPPGSRNSMQGMYVMLGYGVARLMGSVTAGYAAQVHLSWAFASGVVMGVIALVWAALQFHNDAAAVTLARRTTKPIEEPVPETP